jgi:3-phenylpropionate/trans-cinnamate dioxygenase ferredoxin subunit
MAKYIVGTVGEIAPGEKRIVEIAGLSIGIYNVNGEYFAILNRCPHQAGPLCAGNTHGFLKSGEVGEYEYSRPGEIVRCPWHGWEFDVRTGQSWFDPVKVRVRRYEVTVASGTDLIAQEVPDAEPGTTPAEIAAATGDAGVTEAGMEGMLKGPYVAETFPVTIEEEYVVVEVGR